jgi:hypothetical protein
VRPNEQKDDHRSDASEEETRSARFRVFGIMLIRHVYI